MRKIFKPLILLIGALLIFALTGCSNGDKTNNETGTTSENNTANEISPMNKVEYEKYLSERYDYYFDNDVIDSQYDIYDIYDDDFNYTGTYDEFINGYTIFYNQETANLKAFRNDLQTNVRRGDPEVDKINDEIITSVDKAIIDSEEYGKTFIEKTKDYGTLAKDQIISGLRDIGRIPYESRKALDKLIDDVDDRLGVD